MKISSLTLPKDRSLRVPNDDTVLILPGLLGVFDGATAPQKARPMASSGRIASQAAAQAVAGLALAEDLASLPPAQIFAAISARIRAASAREGMEGKPSTTMALAVMAPDHVRFLAVGDSGFRVGGARMIRREKPIDDVSTLNRLAIHAILSARHVDADEVERLTRSVSFEGHDEAVEGGVLTPTEAAGIRDDLVARFAGLTDPDSLRGFLDKGIRQQFHFANRTDHPMGFSTLNGDETSLADIIDERLPIAEVASIEIFSDGYFLIPDAVSVAAWEEAFARTEAEDFHKLHRFANVKGSTSREFADDRSVIVADAINGAEA
ncbi:MAG: protein phosphatase 2C domain-containing protein [Pseudorhodobacter sp.]